LLAHSLYELGRYDEADEWAGTSEVLCRSYDVDGQRLWRQVRAKLLARRGERTEGERLAYEAVALAQRGDAINDHADALLDLAEVLELTEGREEAAAQIEQALALYAHKGNIVMAGRARARLAELQPPEAAGERV
jgi:tetratricopeptide (TPR) repeat protein